MYVTTSQFRVCLRVTHQQHYRHGYDPTSDSQRVNFGGGAALREMVVFGPVDSLVMIGLVLTVAIHLAQGKTTHSATRHSGSRMTSRFTLGACRSTHASIAHKSVYFAGYSNKVVNGLSTPTISMGAVRDLGASVGRTSPSGQG